MEPGLRKNHSENTLGHDEFYFSKASVFWTKGINEARRGDHAAAARSLVFAIWLDNGLKQRTGENVVRNVFYHLLIDNLTKKFILEKDPYAALLYISCNHLRGQLAEKDLMKARKVFDILLEKTKPRTDARPFILVFRSRVSGEIGRTRLLHGDERIAQQEISAQVKDAIEASKALATACFCDVASAQERSWSPPKSRDDSSFGSLRRQRSLNPRRARSSTPAASM
mmetsp:Transcript_6510/g.11229  ORF Transcript_6510/g.11229 Transcript_6510/m.11229 type:complete len:226 (-) Transcript_6510:618-1295(-)